jgi:hypothetical protein
MNDVFHFIFSSLLGITHPSLTKTFWKYMTIHLSIDTLCCIIIRICSLVLILFNHLVLNAFMLMEAFGGIVGLTQHMKHDIGLMSCFRHWHVLNPCFNVGFFLLIFLKY